jgi:hypothetical protein
MSGKKISEMTAITGAQLDQTTDVVPVLDVSDTSNPNKKISIQELASALNVTNASLSLDGSNNLILTDSAGNNVTADLSSFLDDTNTTNASLSLATNTLTLTDSASNSVDVDLSSLDNSGLTLADVTANGGATTERIAIGSTSTSTASVFDVFTSSASGTLFEFRNDTQRFYGGVNNASGAFIFTRTNHRLRLGTNNTEKLRIENTGAIHLLDKTNIGSTAAPTVTLDINGTDAVQLTAGTEAQRPTTPANGMIRYNSDDDVFEGYAGGAWGEVVQFDSSGNIVLNAFGDRLQFGGSINELRYNIWKATASAGMSILNAGGGIGIQTQTPTVTLDINGTDAVQLTSGTTAEQPGQTGQPAAAAGMIRFNTSTSKFEGYDGTSWTDLN